MCLKNHDMFLYMITSTEKSTMCSYYNKITLMGYILKITKSFNPNLPDPVNFVPLER